MKKLLFPFVAAFLLLTGAGSTLMSCSDPAQPAGYKEALARQDKYKVIDDSIIRAYLTRNNYGPGSYTRTDAGLYLVTLAPNPQGAVAATGKQVAVRYEGRLITKDRENVIFDSSYNGRTLCNCFELIVGDQTPGRGTIAGWAQGLPLMRQGERKLLFVPSYLAYGTSSSGIIGPDTPLVFDMEVVAVSE
jgi:FKBP-type peptidyl-prolyl cis-trans isomerase